MLNKKTNRERSIAMKIQYEAPDMQVICLAANEQMALLDGHPHESIARRGKEDSEFHPSWGGVEVPDE